MSAPNSGGSAKGLEGSVKSESSQNSAARASSASSGTPPQPAGAAKQTPAKPAGKTGFSQADLNKIVLEYLAKKGYHKTESMLRMESVSAGSTPQAPVPNPGTTPLTPVPPLGPAADSAAARGKKFAATPISPRVQAPPQQQKYLYAAAAQRDDPSIYERAYLLLKNWIESSLDLYRPELERILYPIFVHSMLDLVVHSHPQEAKNFFDEFSQDHMLLHASEVNALSSVYLPEHVKENEVAQRFRKNKYKVRLSSTPTQLLFYFLHENEAIGGATVIRLINQYLELKVSTSPVSGEDPFQLSADEGIAGHTANMEIGKFNSQPLKLGRMPLEAELEKEVEAELRNKDEVIKREKAQLAHIEAAQRMEIDGESGKLEESEPEEEAEQEETYEETFKRLKKEEDDSPTRDALPLPLPTIVDVEREIQAVSDARAMHKLDPVQAVLPSVCMYTFHNTHNDLNCLEFSEDATLVAGGFADSFVRLWSLDGSPLKSVLRENRVGKRGLFHAADEQQDALSTRRLVGHSGAVYGTSFSPDSRYLLSCSEDKTVRLWSTDTYTSLVSYKGHNHPVWDVAFGPFGHYFATASHDQTARLWSCDHIYPLRIFAGHLSDVDCVTFHPNSTYVFTGSSDKTCRMWDIASGKSVRIFLGHTGAINTLAVSPDGRWLATGGEDHVVNVWDIGTGRRLKTMRGHGQGSIYSLAFSREGSTLVSSGSDCSVRVWDVKKGTADVYAEPEAFSVGVDKEMSGKDSETAASAAAGGMKSVLDDGKKKREVVATPDHMVAYFTKRTPVYKVAFTKKNLCLAAGAFLG